MIDLYSSSSPNVQKIIVMLEETRLPYQIKQVNVHRGEQYSPEFEKLNPNRKVPVIVDQDGPGGKPYTVFESGAILLYLAHKTGLFLPKDPIKQFDAIQWLMLQMSGVGPTFGQFNHFVRFASHESYAMSRFTSETRRLYDLLNARLTAVPYLGGDEYTVADIATFPWIRVEAKLFGANHKVMRRGWEEHPAIARWFETIEARPAVQRALAEIDARPSTLPTATETDLNRYFGRQEFQRTLG